MPVGQCSRAVVSLAILALIGEAAGGSRQTVPAKEPPPETVAKLIAQLGAADFRSRRQASRPLEKLGGPVLPALRKAAKANAEPEVRRRIKLVVSRIENALLKAEEKRWQALDAPRRGIKDRLVKIFAKTPALSDRRVASAVYLLTVGRRPTDEEVKRAQKQFAGPDGRSTTVLRLARSLVQGKKFSADVAAANGRLLRAQQDLASDKECAKKFAWPNGKEFKKLAGDIAALLNKAVKTGNAPFIDLAFLLVLSRFPNEDELKVTLPYLKNARGLFDVAAATEDLVWVLMNTKEFLLAP